MIPFEDKVNIKFKIQDTAGITWTETNVKQVRIEQQNLKGVNMAIANKKRDLVSDDHPRSSLLLQCRNRKNV